MYPYGVMCPSCGDVTPPSARAHVCSGPSLALRRQAERTAIWLGEPIENHWSVGQPSPLPEASRSYPSKAAYERFMGNTDTQITVT